MSRTKKGDVIENPVTGERAITLEGTRDYDEQRLVSEVHIPPGGRLVLEHLHPSASERFGVLDGRLNVSLNARNRMLGIEVPRYRPLIELGGLEDLGEHP